MTSSAHGTDISAVEVTNISAHGFWLLTRTGRELFLPYADFPWFKDQPVSVIVNVEEQGEGHFYWPDLDVDLSEAIIDNPQEYPLVAKQKKQA
ncbi:DUF2442 domain-containing protein [Endozoicomonas sp. Mp262]|uniref:DUF2442 domain-containing protein n=1 Tax=Endozoicomonas sp. Mp262 TaxID=2919499 RepID=UPI0021DAA3DF